MTDAPGDRPRHAAAEHPYGGVEPRYSPEELAELLGGNQPTAQQSAVISAPLTPRLVVAGAGSGKTATMVDRVVWLVANGVVAPDQVLGVTFTRKAAGELSDRINKRIADLDAAGLMPIIASSDASSGAGPSPPPRTPWRPRSSNPPPGRRAFPARARPLRGARASTAP